MKTSVKWFEGARTEKEKKEVIAILTSAIPAFKLLKKIIEKEKVSSYNNRLKKDKYENPSWPYFQADAVGEERTYNQILKLIDIKLED